jgi:hypothetical protein
VSSGLETGFALDRRWHLLRGEMERSKKDELLLLGSLLAREQVPYAVIGGIALQFHSAEPRTTIDIDIVVSDRASLPRDALVTAGFVEKGRHQFSDNWVGPGGTPVQFADDPPLAAAIARALDVELDGVRLRILSKMDLLRAKLRSASGAERRRSKRIIDIADVHALIEDEPALADELSDEERALLDRLPT